MVHGDGFPWSHFTIGNRKHNRDRTSNPESKSCHNSSLILTRTLKIREGRDSQSLRNIVPPAITIRCPTAITLRLLEVGKVTLPCVPMLLCGYMYV